jgi:hypothetical protein
MHGQVSSMLEVLRPNFIYNTIIERTTCITDKQWRLSED